MQKSQLTGVFLKGFQSILQPTFINLEKLTFFYGPNSAGKSSIIDALSIIRSAAVEKNTETSNWGMRRNSHKGVAALGIEFIAQELDYKSGSDINRWSDTPGPEDFKHWEFHKNLVGNKVQVEFADNCESLKIAINNEPFIEITNNNEVTKLYTAFHKSTNKYEEMKDSAESYIFGQIKIHKTSNFFEYIYGSIYPLLSENSNKRKRFPRWNNFQEYHYDLLVNEDDDSISINGIEFSGNRVFDTGYVEISQGIYDLLFYEHDLESEDLKIYSPDANKFLFENFSKKSPEYEAKLANRRRLYSDVCDLAKSIDLIVEGLFFHIRTAIDYSHVRGDRGLLNSEYPMYVEGEGKVSAALENGTEYKKIGTEYKHLQEYALYLSEPYRFTFMGKKIKNDFINDSLKTYLPSLHDYRITSETHKLTRPNGRESNIVFLNVVNKTKRELGFQDVGSGLSYIMPILTSLWASKISIIEQPELHLHPKAQCELGDVFIAAYLQGAASIIETHSEHLLLRVLRRIRETSKNYLLPKHLKISKDDLTIYYFEPVSEGHTIVKRIRVDHHGELLDLWPGGFFSERDSELFS